MQRNKSDFETIIGEINKADLYIACLIVFFCVNVCIYSCFELFA